jgi:hypothetical protein
MSKKQSFTLDALMGTDKAESESVEKLMTITETENSESTELEKEEVTEKVYKAESPIVGQDLISSLSKMKGLKREGTRTKTDISKDINNKIMFYSKLLDVNGYAIVETAIQEWIERNAADLKKLQRQALK